VVGGADDAIEPRLVQAQFLEERHAVRRIQLRNLRLDRGAHGHDVRALLLRTLRDRVQVALSLKPFSATLATYMSGFIVMRCSSRSSGRSFLSIGNVRAGLPESMWSRRPLRISRRRLRPCHRPWMPSPRVAGRARPSRGRRARSSVLITSMSAIGSMRPATCTMSSLTKQRTTWAMASVSRMCARNLLPRPSPLRRPRTRPGDVHELDGGRDDLLGPGDFPRAWRAAGPAQARRPRSGRWCRTGSGRRGVLRLRDRIEERGLADVRQADDAALMPMGLRWSLVLRVQDLHCLLAPSRTNTVSASSERTDAGDDRLLVRRGRALQHVVDHLRAVARVADA